MSTIGLADKVKEKLPEFMKESGSKTFSDAVNLLIFYYENNKKTLKIIFFINI